MLLTLHSRLTFSPSLTFTLTGSLRNFCCKFFAFTKELNRMTNKRLMMPQPQCVSSSLMLITLVSCLPLVALM